MDYFLADRTTLPEGEAAPFTEQIVRMERSHLCYMWHGEPSELQPLPAGQNGFVTFGSLNDFRKVNDDVLRVWAKVLAAVPGSRLLLKAGIFDDAYGKRLALAKMERAGIDVSRVMTDSTKLVDRIGEEFRVVRDCGTCRSVLLNGKQLYLLDKKDELRRLGLWAVRLSFTTENPAEIDGVLAAWRGEAHFDPGACTRGLYLRGVE